MPTTGRSLAAVEVAPHAAVAALARLVLDYRLVTLVVATAGLRFQDRDTHVDLPLLLLALGVANALPLLRWSRIAPFVMRHPVLLAADYLVTLGVLLATGVDGPLLSYTLGTAFLAGVLYQRAGAAIFAALLVAGYLYALQLDGSAFAAAGFQSFVGTPSLYVLLAVGAAAVRTLLLRQAGVEAELAAVRTEAATAQERGRLARELHDSLGKTLYGLTLLAGALPRWIERDPSRAAVEARTLASSAHDAAEQARELLYGMRADRLELALDDAVRGFVQAWSAESGVPADLQVEPVSRVDPSARYELFWILREALRNVQRHARADSVRVALTSCGADVALTVADDGVGMDRADLDALAAGGHFGVLGMRERAECVGGTLTVDRGTPRGTVLVATVPLTSAQDQPTLVDTRSRS